VIYAAISAAWILSSDWLLSSVEGGLSRELSIAKGWAFVAVTSALLYGLVRREIAARKRTDEQKREVALSAERDKRQFYKETILAVTDGKFELCEPETDNCCVRPPELFLEVRNARDISRVRRRAAAYCVRAGLSKEAACDFEIAIGEALANAVKHAHGGTLEAGLDDGTLWISILDRGDGIDTFAIPRVALTPGYTTKASMGLGYTMMLAACDRVRLSTGSCGTNVTLEKRLKEEIEADREIGRYCHAA